MILQMFSTFAKSLGFLSKCQIFKLLPRQSLHVYMALKLTHGIWNHVFPLIKLISYCRIHLLNMQCKYKTNLYQLQSLIWPLIFACSIFLPGRAFLRRLIDLTCEVKDQKALINLTDKSQADIGIWLSLLSSLNGKSVLYSQKWFSRDHIYTLYR